VAVEGHERILIRLNGTTLKKIIKWVEYKLIIPIHDSSNLLALCSICHFAFDAKQWTFLPDDLRKWVDMLKRDPESGHIRNWNSNWDVTFRRWRPVGAADWESSKDDAYVATFTKEPLKVRLELTS
jgi:hypothetical protein